MFWCLYDMHFDLFLPFTCFERIFCYRFHSDIVLLNYEHFLYIYALNVLWWSLVWVLYFIYIECPVWLFPYFRHHDANVYIEFISISTIPNELVCGVFFMHRMWSGHGHDTSLQSYCTCTHILSCDCYKYRVWIFNLKLIFITQNRQKRWTDTLTRKLMINRTNEKKNNRIRKKTCFQHCH